jgi:hypothetical protein
MPCLSREHFCVPSGGCFINIKKKAKAGPVHALKVLGWKGGVAPTHF